MFLMCPQMRQTSCAISIKQIYDTCILLAVFFVCVPTQRTCGTFISENNSNVLHARGFVFGRTGNGADRSSSSNDNNKNGDPHTYKSERGWEDVTANVISVFDINFVLNERQRQRMRRDTKDLNAARCDWEMCIDVFRDVEY